LSYINKQILRGVNDENLSFFTTTLPFTTAVLVVDTLTQFQAYIKEARIVNEDGLNVVLYRQGNPLEPQKTVPINSAVTISGWESFIQVTPNAVTGGGILEIDLIDRFVAEIVKLGK